VADGAAAARDAELSASRRSDIFCFRRRRRRREHQGPSQVHETILPTLVFQPMNANRS
jgi:hypothetical protein